MKKRGAAAPIPFQHYECMETEAASGVRVHVPADVGVTTLPDIGLGLTTIPEAGKVPPDMSTTGALFTPLSIPSLVSFRKVP